MNSASAWIKYLRVPPRKSRLVADLIRGMSVADALLQLQHSKKKAGRLMYQALLSASSNAESRFEVERRDLVVSAVRVDEGPVLKRAKSRSRGSRSPILKRMSHFYIEVTSGRA